MNQPDTSRSERVLILAPLGRDAAIARTLLTEAGIPSLVCRDLQDLRHGLETAAGMVLLAEEAVRTADLSAINRWIGDQPPWSDMPFVLMIGRGGGPERNPAASRLSDVLGNVSFLERPFHPTTLISVARTALRGRRRQYEARASLEALRVGEEHYRTLFEAIDVGFCTIEVEFDADGRGRDYRFIEVNPAFKMQTGLADAAGRWVSDLVPGHEQHWFDAYGRIAATGEAVRFEHRAGALGNRWYDVHAFRVDEPEVRRVAVLFNDISDRKQLEMQLRSVNASLESEVLTRTAERDRVWRNSRDLLAVVAIGGAVHAANPAWAVILGYPPEEVVGRSFADFLWRADVEPSGGGLDGPALADGLTDFESRFRHKDGTPRWISWRTSVEGDLVYAYGREVTAEKAQMEALRQAEETLRQSQKLEAVGQLTGGVAHDFNNLLTIIRSSVDFLRRQDLSEERRRRYVEAVSDTVDRAAKITGQLLAFARRQTLAPEVFEVGDRLRGLADMLDTVTGARIKVVTRLPDACCFVRADLSQFETALINMAVNARDAMNGEGTLTLGFLADLRLPSIRGQVAAPGPFAAITLTDTGSGIPADLMGRIFEPFFTTKEVGKGTGLGLSQVFGFAKQSGGDVDVASQPGRGTTFTLYLPRVERMEEQRGEDQPEAGPAPGGGGQHVLVVEDNPEVGRFATQTLQDLGYRTIWAADGNEALARLDEAPTGFDVVFSDVVMPGMNGVELGQEIRRHYPGLPVVLASGYSHVLVEQGSHGFELLQKPYSVDQLSRVLRHVTAPRRPRSLPAS